MKLAQRTAVVVITLALGIYGGGCSNTRQVSPVKFVRKAQTPVTTVHDVSFVGVHQNRAYLSEWTLWPVIGPRKRLLWTPASRLSPELLRELEATRVREELEAKKSREAHAAAAKLRP